MKWKLPRVRIVRRRVPYRFAHRSLSASELIQRFSVQYRILDPSVQEQQIEDTVEKIYEQGSCAMPNAQPRYARQGKCA